MKKKNPNSSSTFVLLLLLITTTTATTLVVVVGNGNGSASPTTDSLVGDEEFLMGSETSRRILAAIGPDALNPKRPYCNARIYNNCIRKPNTNYDKRPCTYKNSCNRKGV